MALRDDTEPESRSLMSFRYLRAVTRSTRPSTRNLFQSPSSRRWPLLIGSVDVCHLVPDDGRQHAEVDRRALPGALENFALAVDVHDASALRDERVRPGQDLLALGSGLVGVDDHDLLRLPR